MIYLLAILAVWRVVVMLQKDMGPAHIFEKFRNRYIMDGDEVKSNNFAEMFACPHCLSVWVAIVPALFIATSVSNFFLLVLAFSGGAILVNNFSE